MLIATPMMSGAYNLELFNHRTDPLLKTNVVSTEPDIVQQLSPVLDAWHAELDAANAPVSERTKEQEDALRQLGYIE